MNSSIQNCAHVYICLSESGTQVTAQSAQGQICCWSAQSCVCTCCVSVHVFAVASASPSLVAATYVYGINVINFMGCRCQNCFSNSLFIKNTCVCDICFLLNFTWSSTFVSTQCKATVCCKKGSMCQMPVDKKITWCPQQADGSISNINSCWQLTL